MDLPICKKVLRYLRPGRKYSLLYRCAAGSAVALDGLSNLNIFARHADRVRTANIAQMINVLQAMLLTDKEKMVLTPTYYVYKMYVPFQDATFVPVTFDAAPTHKEASACREWMLSPPRTRPASSGSK